MPYDQVFKTYNSKEDKRLRSSLLGETHVAWPNRYIEGRQQEMEAGLVSHLSYRVVEAVKVKTNKYSCNIHHRDTKE